MNVETIVCEYIKPLSSNIPETAKSIGLSAKLLKIKLAGFSLYADAERLKQNIQSSDVLKIVGSQLGLKLLIDRPSFGRVMLSVGTKRTKTTVVETETFMASAIPIATKEVSLEPYAEFASRLLIQSPEIILMTELRLEEFKGFVPDFAVDACFNASQAGLTLRIWVAGTKAELSQYIQKTVTRMRIDPVIVAYASEPLTNVPQQCLFVCAWGKDLENINMFFAK